MLRAATEDEMVAEFLRGEIDGPRWEQQLRGLLAVAGAPESLVRTPDVSDDCENMVRRLVLAGYRGWRINQYLFVGFPAAVRWQSAKVSIGDLERAEYGNAADWIAAVGGTRSVKAAADAIRAGLVQAPRDGVLHTQRRYEQGESVARPILVQETGSNRLVVLEGFTRVTAWLLASPSMTDELDPYRHTGLSADLAHPEWLH